MTQTAIYTNTDEIVEAHNLDKRQSGTTANSVDAILRLGIDPDALCGQKMWYVFD